jgi:iron complex outermembrane receptor protein
MTQNYTKQALIGAFLLFFGQIGLAQSGDSTQLLSDVLIRENRLELPFSEQSRTIQVLTQAQLRAMPVQSVAEALQSVTGVDVRQRGPFGVQADLHVRGGGFDQALVLLNGVRLSDPQTGHHLLNLPIDWGSIQQIEVLKGPGARVYGQNAFACAINIVTTTPEKFAVQAGIGAGDFGYRRAELGLDLPIGNYRQRLAFSGELADGYRYNTDFELLNGFYQGNWSGRGAGEWSLMAGYTQRKFGANGYYGRLEFQDQYEELQTSLLALSYRRQWGNWQIKPRLYWRRNQDWYVFQRPNPAVFQNFHLSQVAGAECNASWQNGWGLTGIGLNVEHTALTSTRLGVRERQTLNLFVEHRFSLLRQRLDITPGFTATYFTDFGSFAFPGVDLGLRLSDSWKLFANAGYNYRIPTFTDLYYEDAGNRGNPNLEPESALALELGAKYAGKGWSASAALFRRDGNNLIDYSKESEPEKWTANNFSQVMMQGAELNLDMFFPTFWGKNAWLQRLNLGYTALDADAANSAAFSRYTLNHLRHQLTANLEHRIAGPLRHSIRLRWCDRLVADNSVPGDYTVVDAKLFANWRRFHFYAEATNLLDARYGELRYSPTAILTMPGRWFRAGARVRID